MKQIALKLFGSDSDPLIVELWPGVTSRDILAEADLADCVLARKNTSSFLSPQEVLYDLLIDGEMVHAQYMGCL